MLYKVCMSNTSDLESPVKIIYENVLGFEKYFTFPDLKYLITLNLMHGKKATFNLSEWHFEILISKKAFTANRITVIKKR